MNGYWTRMVLPSSPRTYLLCMVCGTQSALENCFSASGWEYSTTGMQSTSLAVFDWLVTVIRRISTLSSRGTKIVASTPMPLKLEMIREYPRPTRHSKWSRWSSVGTKYGEKRVYPSPVLTRRYSVSPLNSEAGSCVIYRVMRLSDGSPLH